MSLITLDYSNVMDFVCEGDLSGISGEISDACGKLENSSGAGSDFLGWVNLPGAISRQLLDDIMETARRVREDSDVFLVIGIGGSYLGSRAAIEALLPSGYNQRLKPEIYFLGTSISPRQLQDVLHLLEGKRVTVNVISKSGTTTEPALAFRNIREWMIKTYGKDEASRRIIATTDASRGALRTLADSENLKTYVIPDDVGGRFSVLTPVGLLPIAAAGLDVKALVEGALDGMREYRGNTDVYRNPSLMYAALRNLLYRGGKNIEILANFEPQLHYISEWWKQLYGESEGKEGKGIFPASVDFTSDLHSMGQWIQEGRREIFETFLHVQDPGVEVSVGHDPQNLDGLNFLSGKSFAFVNEQALLGTRSAHREGGVPNMTINLPSLSEYTLGKLFYFFEWGVGVSGYVLGVNPFDQPGVEQYKRNMFALLDKPGFESESGKVKESLAKRKVFLSSKGEVREKAGK